MGRRNLELRSAIGRQQTDPRLKLWMEFLRISPSYALAWEVLEGRLSEQQAIEQVSDLDLLIKTAKDFGDVWAVDPEQHWRAHSFELFGVQLAELDLKVVHVMQTGQPIDQDQLDQQIREYAAHTRREMGNPLTVLVSVPIDMNRQHLMQLFGGMLTYFKENREDYDDDLTPEPKYVIAKNRKPLRSLRQLLDIVAYKAARPHLTHKMLGIELNLNRVFAEVLTGERTQRAPAEAVNVMNATVSRLLRQALLIAENAARGRFPNQTAGSQFFQEFVYSKVRSNT